MPSPFSYDEIQEMIYHDRADEALDAAISKGHNDLIRLAARVILCSGCYDSHKRLAAQHCEDSDLAEKRKQILGN